jgi:hypothetical protein
VESLLGILHLVDTRRISQTGYEAGIGCHSAGVEGKGGVLLDRGAFRGVGRVYHDGVAEDVVPGGSGEFEQKVESGGQDG